MCPLPHSLLAGCSQCAHGRRTDGGGPVRLGSDAVCREQFWQCEIPQISTQRGRRVHRAPDTLCTHHQGQCSMIWSLSSKGLSASIGEKNTSASIIMNPPALCSLYRTLRYIVLSVLVCSLSQISIFSLYFLLSLPLLSLSLSLPIPDEDIV